MYENTKTIARWTGELKAQTTLDPVLYDAYGVKRGLRDKNGKGVLAGLTEISQVQGKQLVMNLGYSHNVVFDEPEGIKFETPNTNTIVISGPDKQQVGQIAANIRSKRPPEPYLGKGIKYSDEIIRRKAGKAGKSK